ncbi:MAG: TIGR03936 family radical SAM-associated protein [Armatimonadota bacterium]
MQRIICRYRRDVMVCALSHAEVRHLLLSAVETAGLPVGDGRRVLVMGPPLPTGATSEAERFVLELSEPRDPVNVRRWLNLQLPDGLRIEQAWIAKPGGGEENPAQLDEAIYHLEWQGAPPADELLGRIQKFLASPVVPFTRVRENKTQSFNARALVRDIRLLGSREGAVRLQMTVSVGPQGTVRPEEVPQLLDYAAPADGAFRVHRVALHQSCWRRLGIPCQAERWRRR